MRAFIEVRRALLKQNDLKEQLKEIKERLGEHYAQLNQIYDALENLLDEKAAQRKWEEWKEKDINSKLSFNYYISHLRNVPLLTLSTDILPTLFPNNPWQH